MIHAVRSIAASRRRMFIRLLLLAFVAAALFPFHYHLHHDSDSHHGEKHVVESHALLETEHADHHQTAHTIDPASDLTLKSTPFQLAFALLASLLLFLLPLSLGEARHGPAPVDQRLPRFRWITSPPLRAPPAR